MLSSQARRTTLAVAGVTGIVLFGAQACQLTAADNEQVEAPSDSGQTPQQLLAPWFAPDVERVQIDRALAVTHDRMDFVRADYSLWSGLLGWALGEARPTEPGPELAQCYVSHAPQLESKCIWAVRLVIERQGPQVGEVVYVELRASQRDQSCDPLLECVANSWRGASAPLADTEDRYVAIEFGGIPCTLGEGLSGQALRDQLDKREAMASESLTAMQSCSGQACDHNRQVEEACLTHIAEMKQRLEDAEP